MDRDRVQQMGVSVQAVNDALQSYMGQVYVNDITLDNRNWQVTVQADGPFRRSADDLSKIKVRGPNGEMIPIAGLIKTEPYQGPSKVNRYQMYPSADLNGFTIPFLISSGQAIDKMEALAQPRPAAGAELRVDRHGVPAEAGGEHAGRGARACSSSAATRRCSCSR